MIKYESVNEALWPKSKLSSRFQFLLAPELKKKFKGIFYVDGYGLYHNDKLIMKINPDKDSVNSIVNHVSRNRSIQKNESINEASRRATDFFGDSKYGKAIHKLLGGKWDSRKVQKFFDKLGDGNDVSWARMMDFIAGDLGLNIRSYTTVSKMEKDMITKMESLYTDFLSESVNESMLNEWRAEEVLHQLGGRKFIAMTGASSFVKDDKNKSIYFKIGGGAKGGINYIRITLTSMDLYDVEFLKLRGGNMKVVATAERIYNDQLQSIFTKYTGMRTSL
jgi:hypothetical protein